MNNILLIHDSLDWVWSFIKRFEDKPVNFVILTEFKTRFDFDFFDIILVDYGELGSKGNFDFLKNAKSKNKFIISGFPVWKIESDMKTLKFSKLDKSIKIVELLAIYDKIMECIKNKC